MTSQDVIHSFFVPAFRIKQDVLPGRYTTIWFEATKPGKYHLFCAEYCGTKHSGMIGWVYAMEPQGLRAWLGRGRRRDRWHPQAKSCFTSLAARNCHHFDDHGRCPTLRRSLRTPGADRGRRDGDRRRTYIRESILEPRAKIVCGLPADYADFQGQLSEDQVIALISYIKSIGRSPAPSSQPVPGTLRRSTDSRQELPDRDRPLTPERNQRLANYDSKPSPHRPKRITSPKSRALCRGCLTTDHKRIGYSVHRFPSRASSSSADSSRC